MTTPQRIAVNALATYGRTVFGMALGLFSGRWVYQALGQADYGLMSVVGGLIGFVTFLSGVTSSTSARFYALSIGKKDPDETNRWFNTALSIHTVLPVILTLIGWVLGEWAVVHFLNIPPARVLTARWVFRFSLFSALCGMLSAPYIGMFTAKQHIAEMSVWGMLEVLLNFAFVYYLTCYTGDAWMLYSGGTVSILAVITLCQVLRARSIFPECRICLSRCYEMARIRKVLTFSGWQLFGVVGSVLRGQGIAILLNKYFAPALYPHVNASYSVGNAVSGYSQTLASALLGAFTPEITATEGSGDRARMLRLANKASKFGTWLVLLFAIPLLIEVDGLLILWLKDPPELAGIFCWLIIAQFLIERLTFGHMVAVNAVGKIAGYQMLLGGLLILTLPIAWLFLALGLSPVSVAWAIIITSSGLSFGRIVLAKPLIGASPLAWLKEVLFPCVLVFAVGMTVGYTVVKVWGAFSFFRLCAVTFATMMSWMVLGWFVVMGETEKVFFLSNVQKACSKFKKVP